MHSLYIQWMPQWIGMKNICFSVTKSAAFMHPRAWHSRALGTSRGVLWTWNIFFYVSFFHYALSVSLFLRFPPMVFLNSLVWSELLSLCAYVCVPVYVIICLCSYRLCFLKNVCLYVSLTYVCECMDFVCLLEWAWTLLCVCCWYSVMYWMCVSVSTETQTEHRHLRFSVWNLGYEPLMT